MSEECLIWSTNNRVCQEKRGKSLGEKAKKSLVKAAEMRKDDLITAAQTTVISVWVSDACYKRYTHQRNINKTVTVGDDCAGDQPNQSFERPYQSVPFGYQTHCLVFEGKLNFDFAESSET